MDCALTSDIATGTGHLLKLINECRVGGGFVGGRTKAQVSAGVAGSLWQGGEREKNVSTPRGSAVRP